MKYLVRYDTSMTEAEKKEILDSMNEFNLEFGYPLLTDTGIPDVSEKILRAKNRKDLDSVLLTDYGINQNKIISVLILEDDSLALLKDHEILDLANEEPTCANYDWTSDNVMSFARKLIAKMLEAQQACGKDSAL